MENPLNNMVDSMRHCNYKVSQKIAEKIFENIKVDLNKNNMSISTRVALQDYYIPWDVIKYYKEYFEKHHLVRSEKKCGAIVMNCNPFTKGHRYLIEQAASQVDLLYVFIVEEDKSAYRFIDRVEMVFQGTADLKNVKVLPSGRYIISKETFSQYFEKDNVKQIDNMDYDVRIFGEVITKKLGISVRFVGEEPFDRVTKKYNETIQRILPDYGVEVMEIPRKQLWNGSIISASAVRKAIAENNESVVKAMLPETTIKYLKNLK